MRWDRRPPRRQSLKKLLAAPYREGEHGDMSPQSTPSLPPALGAEQGSRDDEIRNNTAFLLQRYGPLLTREDLVKVLGFPTPAAFDRYQQRGHLELRLVRPPNRRGVFAHASDVARYLAEIPRDDAGVVREKADSKS